MNIAAFFSTIGKGLHFPRTSQYIEQIVRSLPDLRLYVMFLVMLSQTQFPSLTLNSFKTAQ